MNDQLNPTEPLGGSSIFRPMDKFHAVGQGKYTGFYITVYMHAANFAESSTRSSANELRYAEFVFLVRMVPPIWWAASSWCCGPISKTVMGVFE